MSILKNFVERATADISEECEKCSAAVSQNQTTTTKLIVDLEALTIRTDAVNSALAAVKAEIFGRLTAEDALRRSIEASTLHTFENLKRAVGNQEMRIEGLSIRTKQCDDKLTEWSTKDFYEKVADLLRQNNPSWFAMGAEIRNHGQQLHSQNLQLQALSINYHNVISSVKGVMQHQQQARAAAAAAPAVPALLPAPSPRQNGILPQQARQPQPISPVDNYPVSPDAAYVIRTLKNLDETAAKVKKLEEVTDIARREMDEYKKRLDEHLATFNKWTDDLQEWSQNAQSELTRARAVEESTRGEVNSLRTYIEENVEGGNLTAGTKKSKRLKLENGVGEYEEDMHMGEGDDYEHEDGHAQEGK